MDPPTHMLAMIQEIILVVCLSTNGERALNYTIVKFDFNTSTQAIKIKSSF